jgi:hypothetical protein
MTNDTRTALTAMAALMMACWTGWLFYLGSVQEPTTPSTPTQRASEPLRGDSPTSGTPRPLPGPHRGAEDLLLTPGKECGEHRRGDMAMWRSRLYTCEGSPPRWKEN